MARTPPNYSAAKVAALIQANMEPSDAEDVLAALKRLEGQAITTRLLDRLPGGRVDWRIRRELGATEICNRAYLRPTKHGVGLCLTVARRGVRIVDAAFVERENAEYFARRRARNALRAKAIANAKLLERMALVFSEIEDAKLPVKTQQITVFAEQFVEPEERHHLERIIELCSKAAAHNDE